MVFCCIAKYIASDLPWRCKYRRGDYDSSGDNDAVYKIHPARILMTRLRQLMVGNPIFPIRQSKRGLGHCINNCMRGGGSMNFIQCKSLCH
ncbi:teretoxin Tan14.1-like isoform X2 [Gigantopelta aegis]|uniref:teretoxin Tan14.1-like isoform X2 n=1 Tax=Gigantopelta aegis TaxID=1735272 RepID=UPI001B889878|nr:teretoxin Tan14.1-like isoform X2 [Gigantopelta aegis]